MASKLAHEPQYCQLLVYVNNNGKGITLVTGFSCTAQVAYLHPLQFLNASSSGTLDPCDNCNSGPIQLGDHRIPFGLYYHHTAYVSLT